MYRIVTQPKNKALALASLLAVLFALLPQFAVAQHRHADPVAGRSPLGHEASVSAPHVLFTPNVRRLRLHTHQSKAHAAVSPQERRVPVSTHPAAHAVLYARTHLALIRSTSTRDPLARHLAPNAPPVIFGAPVTSALLTSLTTYQFQVCLLRPCLGRAPPHLL